VTKLTEHQKTDKDSSKSESLETRAVKWFNKQWKSWSWRAKFYFILTVGVFVIALFFPFFPILYFGLGCAFTLWVTAVLDEKKKSLVQKEGL